MNEHEVRVLNINPEEIHTKLLQSGATWTPERRILTKSYTFPKGAFSRDVWVRLRLDERPEEGTQWQLSLKSRAHDEHTVAEEIAVGVTDPKQAEKILCSLGAVLRREIEKYRTSYVLRNVHFDVERFSMIPPYLEVEASSHGDVMWGLQVLGYTVEHIFRGESVFSHYGVDAVSRVH